MYHPNVWNPKKSEEEPKRRNVQTNPKIAEHELKLAAQIASGFDTWNILNIVHIWCRIIIPIITYKALSTVKTFNAFCNVIEFFQETPNWINSLQNKNRFKGSLRKLNNIWSATKIIKTRKKSQEKPKILENNQKGNGWPFF